MQIKFYCPILVLTAYCFLLTSLCAQDFPLELMKSRASLDGVIMDAGPKYHEIKAQADSISETIERLREELHSIEDLKIEDSRLKNQQSLILNLESKFRRRVVCIHLSIKALKAEIDKYSCMGTAI